MGYQITSTPLSFFNLRSGWWLGVVAVTAFHYRLSGYIETDLINCAYIYIYKYIYFIWLIYIWMTEQVELIIQWNGAVAMVTDLRWLDATLIVVIKMIGAVGSRGWPHWLFFSSRNSDSTSDKPWHCFCPCLILHFILMYLILCGSPPTIYYPVTLKLHWVYHRCCVGSLFLGDIHPSGQRWT